MRFYKKTGCRVFLVGCLHELPELQMDLDGEFFATLVINRKKAVSDKLNQLSADTIFPYRVFVKGQSALRIRQFGFVGLYLWIEGDFQNTGEIFAEKTSFLNFPDTGEIDCAHDSMDNLSYRESCRLSFIENDHNIVAIPPIIN